MPRAPRNWQTFSVFLELKDWPRTVRLANDALRLFVVPVANLVRDFADPIRYAGMTETVAVRHPNRSQNYALHSVLGAYSARDGQFEPIESGLVSSSHTHYRLVSDDPDGSNRAPSISINMPEAFDAPTTISIEALWHQPWFSELVRERVDFQTYQTPNSKIRWETAGPIVPFVKPPEWGLDDEYLELFALQHKPRFKHDELKSLLAALGSVGGRAFDMVMSRWSDTDCIQKRTPKVADGRLFLPSNLLMCRLRCNPWRWLGSSRRRCARCLDGGINSRNSGEVFCMKEKLDELFSGARRRRKWSNSAHAGDKSKLDTSLDQTDQVEGQARHP